MGMAMGVTTPNLETITTRITTKGLTTITITIISSTILKAILDITRTNEGTVGDPTVVHLWQKGLETENRTPKNPKRKPRSLLNCLNQPSRSKFWPNWKCVLSG